MTELSPGFSTDDACLAARLELVVLTLSVAVNQLRAVRGDGREERFAGVVMRDKDVAAMCAEMISDPLPPNSTIDIMLGQARNRYASRVGASSTLPAFERIVQLYGLTDLEETLFATALAAMLDPRVARILGYLNEDMARQYLTPALARRIWAGDDGLSSFWRALSCDGTLIRYGLLTLGGPPNADVAIQVPDAVQRLIVSGPTQHELAGSLPLDGMTLPQGPLLIEAAQPIDALIALGESGPVFMSHGGTVGDVLAAGILAAMKGQAHVITGWDDASDADRATLGRGLGRTSVMVTKRPAVWVGQGVVFARVTAPRSQFEQRQEFWTAIAGDAAELLAHHGQLRPDGVWRMTQEATDVADLMLMLRQACSEPMQGLADLIAPRFTFDDLELPARQMSRLAAFAGRRQSDKTVLESWGLGAVIGAHKGAIALFLGPSGVGKTMAASVVAQAAGLDLWRINLATLVSKYIGETEANLDRIFSAADRADVMLFFDEAEALFSKRGEVKDARDRFANMQMAYLLQRIEDFCGMAVLASNMGTSLDPAMTRRFDLVMDFQLPDVLARRRLWGKIETSNAPLAQDVDLDCLADQFELAGGHIRQAILAAAHDAVRDGQINQAHLMRAVAREYIKMGRPLRREDFGTFFSDVRGLG